MICYDSAGNLADEGAMLKSAGLEIGVMCKDKTGNVAIIRGVGNGKVALESACGKSSYEATYILFRDEWTMIMDRAELKDSGIVPNYIESLADQNEANELALAWGQVHQSFKWARDWIKRRHAQPLFRMHTKPEKRVFLEADAKATPYPLYRYL